VRDLAEEIKYPQNYDLILHYNLNKYMQQLRDGI